LTLGGPREASIFRFDRSLIFAVAFKLGLYSTNCWGGVAVFKAVYKLTLRVRVVVKEFDAKRLDTMVV